MSEAVDSVTCNFNGCAKEAAADGRGYCRFHHDQLFIGKRQCKEDGCHFRAASQTGRYAYCFMHQVRRGIRAVDGTLLVDTRPKRVPKADPTLNGLGQLAKAKARLDKARLEYEEARGTFNAELEKLREPV